MLSSAEWPGDRDRLRLLRYDPSSADRPGEAPGVPQPPSPDFAGDLVGVTDDTICENAAAAAACDEDFVESVGALADTSRSWAFRGVLISTPSAPTESALGVELVAGAQLMPLVVTAVTASSWVLPSWQPMLAKCLTLDSADAGFFLDFPSSSWMLRSSCSRLSIMGT